MVGGGNLNFNLKQVPGVEADDVIGTLGVRSVNAGFKVFPQATLLVPENNLLSI